MKIDHLDMPPTGCPYCGAVVDMASNVGGTDRPAEGDATICLYCREVSVFDKNLLLRRPSEDERSELLANPDIQRVLRVVEEVVPLDLRPPHRMQ